MALRNRIRSWFVGPDWKSDQLARATKLESKESNKPWTGWGSWREKRRNIRAENIRGRVQDTMPFVQDRAIKRGEAWAMPPAAGGSRALTELMEQVGTTIPTLPDYPNPEVVYDENGNPIQLKMGGETIRDYSNIGGAVNELFNLQPPTYEEWAEQQGISPMGDITQSAEYQGLSALIEQLREGPSDEDLARAQEMAATQLGMTPDELSETARRTAQAVEGGPEGMTGLSPEQVEARERAQQVEERRLETVARRLIQNAHASYGSSARAMAHADTAIQQIADQRVQYDMMMAEDQATAKMDQWEAQAKYLEQLLTTQQITSTQYLQALTQNRSDAFGAYAAQLQTIMTQNGQYLEMYKGELDRIAQHAEGLYRAINASLGVDDAIVQAIDDEMSKYYDEYMRRWEDFSLRLTAAAEAHAWSLEEQQMVADWFNVAISGLDAVVPDQITIMGAGGG